MYLTEPIRVLRWGVLLTWGRGPLRDFSDPSGFLGKEGHVDEDGVGGEIPSGTTTRDHPHAGAIAPRGWKIAAVRWD
jgi:hypothetical protein